MNLKLFVVFILLCSLIAAGCVAEDDTGADGNVSDGNVSDENQSAVSEEDNVTTGMDNETPSMDDEMQADENDTTSVEETKDGSGVTVVDSTGSKTYTITLRSYSAIPSNQTINQGDSIFWINMQQPTKLFTLVSTDGLWENRRLNYRSSFTYTFNETGTYSYYILEQQNRMKGTITVK